MAVSFNMTLCPAETLTHFLQNYQDEDGTKKYQEKLVSVKVLISSDQHCVARWDRSMRSLYCVRMAGCTCVSDEFGLSMQQSISNREENILSIELDDLQMVSHHQTCSEQATAAAGIAMLNMQQ